MNPIVIVGSGLAGYNVARELRKLDKETPLTLISADSAYFYSKPMLSSALGSGKTPEAIPMNTAEQMATQLNATVRPHVHVTAIDPAQKAVHLYQETLPYSKLVLALGADQIRLTISGNAAERVMTVNDLTDYTQFREAIAGKEKIAVIGGGLIGCEFANDLTAGGFKVSVIDIAPQPLSRLLPPQGAAMLQSKLAALGVEWHLGTSVSAINGDGDKVKLTLASGEILEVDIVLSAVGLRPRIALAQAAGLTTNRGIVVDRSLATSNPDIYALGDCAEVAGLVLPYVMPIMHSARALAATLSGKPTAVSYPAMPVLVKTPACPTIISPPAAGVAGEWTATADADGVKSLFQDSAGKLLGFALNGKATAERAALAPQLPPVLA
ncbi:MAG: FAD-dependent pyridine nucleotide-disulfide oxidoreductase [Betaproteobacteria bacterium]|nr:FAD-dependent pyridine nucleotide-disulfide oxidoreductase [Betaproteobacteria bacterium]